MGSDITLSKAVRGNLLSLQSTSDLLTKTQERLSTGLKVNSALDNPTNFFTASSLNSRASDLSRLLDSVGNATQTLEAADNGISAITDLVEAAQATARQALQTSSGITGGTTTIASATGTGAAIGADTAAALEGSATNDLAGTTSAAVLEGGALTGTDAASTLGAAADSFELSIGGDTYTFDLFDSGTAAYAGANVGIDIAAGETIADAITAINGALAADGNSAAINGSGNFEITAGDTADTITIDPNTNSTAGFLTALGVSSGGTAAPTTDLSASQIAADGDSFELSVGSNTYSFDFFDSGTAAYAGANIGIDIAAGEEIADVIAAIDSALSADGNGASINGSGNLEVTAGATGETVTIDPNATSTAGVLTSLGLTSGDTADTTNADLAALAGSDLTADVGSASFSYSFTAASTKADLDAQLATFATDNAEVAVASTDASGNLTITAAEETDSVTLGGTALTSFGTNLTTTAIDPVTTGGTNRREDLETDFNELLVQIDELKNDAGFNGKNLLDGDDLKVTFNEDGSSSLTIGGVDFDSAGLGLSSVTAGDFDTDANIEATLATLDTATSTLRSQASKFGSNLSVVETRESFTKETINTLETGAANLTLADLNEEGANLLSLQTRQSLSSTALSLASQADQNVLRLL
ncbi:flagellin [Pararhizobium sp. IMCC21322]|uniref:flagellin N-terminal helical domain-containing protein n=1 Tax=Pararhizobium sp. IMCC21322 TaxID=3067903 RepID=UPI0027403675|nr:flagellin [Pararhizobium sp. IMCC21322]